MKLQDSEQNQNASGVNNQTANAITTFSIAGIITMPAKQASTVATIGAVFTVLFLLDLFFDINPVKDMYRKVFPKKIPGDDLPK